uniref:thermonuclease family protein n=1 Tax=uncultured Micrococcus sp. TaxID=114051 RepID=UPI002604543E|nr:thermonuclease family protein [uncultured Micrococcus sp.]
MTPLRPLRTGLAAASAALALVGCTASDPSPASGPPSAAGTSGAAVHPAAEVSPSTAPSDAVEGDAAVVVRVVDGDTVDVRKDGEAAVTRVRLLNIDTPETKHPSKAVQCRGPEAAALLESLLEEGDHVTLQYDEERYDRFHRTLAGVFEGATLVNAEIARAGLGVPVVFEPNRRFYDEVLAAWNEAEEDGAGLNQPGLDCSLPVMAEQAPAGAEPAEGVLEELALAYAGAASGEQAWMSALYPDVLSRVKHLVSTGTSSAGEGAGGDEAPTASAAPEQRAEGQRAAEGRAAEQRAEEERAAEQRAAQEREAEQREAARKREAAAASARAAEAEAEERAAAARRAAEEKAAETAPRNVAGTSGGSGSGSSSSGRPSGGTSSKAPNRCYAPGGETFVYCDEEGSSGSGGSGGSGSGSGSGSSGSAAGAGGPVAGSGGVCPDGYPVKVSSSGKYHVPGGEHYDQTSAKNCYASTSAAAAAGFIASQR